MKIYVASSWRNDEQPKVVAALRRENLEVYDFKNPANGPFHWSDIDPDWEKWDAVAFARKLDHPRAVAGYMQDFNAIMACDACLLVMPCGRSSHLELGLACGLRKGTAILLSGGEPELMYRMADELLLSLGQAVHWACRLRNREAP